ncbi:hypothetical protein [Rhodanobacter lindaniclasticus]
MPSVTSCAAKLTAAMRRSAVSRSAMAFSRASISDWRVLRPASRAAKSAACSFSGMSVSKVVPASAGAA